MNPSFHGSRKIGLAAILAVISIAAGFVLSSGRGNLLSEPRPAGSARLISVEPLPEMDGQMCEWVPASASSALEAALWQERMAARAAASSAADEAKRAEVHQRKPLRMIRDSYAVYSAVAVDAARNEVVLQDENLFGILVYDRQANTPPTAKMTEPKRMIYGMETHIEFNCALYIDPRTGDIYSVNNDTMDTLTIFSRQAQGNAPPDRKLYTPHGTFGVVVDEEEQEMFLTVQHNNAVSVFPKTAKDDDPPIRLLQGDQTLLADPHGIALDTKNNLIFVSNFGSTASVSPDVQTEQGRAISRGQGKPNWPLTRDFNVPGSGKIWPPSITVYHKKASGDTAPLRVIQGPKTQMNWPTGLVMDSERGELYVSNDMGDSILVFDASARGDAAPKRVLKGPKTLIKNPTSVALDLENGELWVANFGNHTATVHPLSASGDTAPLRVIRSAPLDAPTPAMGNPHPVAYDSKREEILVPN